MNKEPHFIYFRQSNGLSYQCIYNPNLTLAQMLKQIITGEVPNFLKPISKGRLLEINLNLNDNKIFPNDIIHLLTLSREQEEKGYIYVSFQNKIHRVEFNTQQSIRQLKRKIFLETGLQQHLQLILFNSIQLQNSKKVKDYEMRSGDFLCMAPNLQTKPLIYDIPQIIFPKKNTFQKRRGSECFRKQDLPNLNLVSLGNNKENNQQKQKIHEVSISNMMSPSCLYGPSPLSDYDFTSFKTSMDQWIDKKTPGIPEQSFGGISGWLSKQNLNQQNHNNNQLHLFNNQTQPNHQVENLKIPVNHQIILCESLNYEQQNPNTQNNIKVSQQYKKNDKNELNTLKIYPKLAFSTSLTQSKRSEIVNLHQKSKENNKQYKFYLKNIITNKKILITDINRYTNTDTNTYTNIEQNSSKQSEFTMKSYQELKQLIYDIELKKMSQFDIIFYMVGQKQKTTKMSEKQIKALLIQIKNKEKTKQTQNQSTFMTIGYQFVPKNEGKQ